MATGSYAAVAAEQPLGLTALRFRGIRYWWAGIGITVLVLLYIGPIAAALRQPAVPAPTTPLSSLSLPSAAFPLLRVPRVRPLAPLPPTRNAQASPHRSAQKTAPAAHVPVVSDSYELVPQAASRTAAPADPTGNAPTVVDTTGVPMAPAAPAAAGSTATPTQPATQPESTPTSDASAAPGSDVPPPAPSPSTRSGASRSLAVVAETPAPSSDQIPAATPDSPTAPDQTQTVVVGTDQPVAAPPPPPDTPVAAGGDSSAGAQTESAQPGDTSGAAGATGATGAGGTSGGSTGTSADATPTQQQSDGATPTPTGTSGSAPDPNTNTSSGLSPPSAGLVTPTGGGTATSTDGSASVAFTAGSVSTNVTVSVSVGGAAPAGIDAVGSVVSLKAVAGDGSEVDTFAAAPILTIHYDPNGPTPSAIYYLDPTNGPQRIDGTVDATAHTISAALPHFSDYVAAADPSGQGAITADYDSGTNTFSLIGTCTICSATSVNPGDPVTISFTGTAQLTLIGTHLAGYTGQITVDAGSTTGNTYILDNGFGNVVIKGDTSDTLDFTANTHPIAFDGTTFTDAPGTDQLTFGNSTVPSHIDVRLTPGTNFDPTADITNVVNKLKDVVTAVDNGVSALSTTLPLLDPGTQPTLDRLSKLISSFNDFATHVASSVSSGTISALGAHYNLSDLVSALNGVTSGLGTSNPLHVITFSTAYDTTGSDLVAYLEMGMASPGTASTTIALTLGTLASGLGLNLTDPTTGNPPTLDVSATVDVKFGIGADVSGTAGAYVDPTGHINLGISIGTSALHATVNVGLLEASVSSGTIGPLTGTVDLALSGSSPIAAVELRLVEHVRADGQREHRQPLHDPCRRRPGDQGRRHRSLQCRRRHPDRARRQPRLCDEPSWLDPALRNR